MGDQMDGWISLHRKVMNHAVFSDPCIFRLFTLCLMKATYTKRSIHVGGQKVELEPGQFVTGRDALAIDYNEGIQKKVDKVDARTLWRWVKRLETWGCLSCNSSNKFTVVTIVNWAEYQDADGETVQQIDHQNVQQVSSTCPTDVQLMSTNNKEIKKQINKETNKEEKIHFAEFVTMTQSEYNKLIDRLGEDRTKAYIERLDNYKGSTGKRYKSDYRTILTWVDKDEANQASNRNNQNLNGGTKHGSSHRRDEHQVRSGRRDEESWVKAESDFFG